MLQLERNAAKETSRKGAVMKTMNLNEGLVSTIVTTKTMEEAGGNDSDEDVRPDRLQRGQTITRKKLDVKADNINQVFADNIDIIADQVNTFAQMEEETVANDPMLQYERQKQQYDEEITNLAGRIEKQSAQKKEFKKLAAAAREEVAQLEDEREQYQAEIDKVAAESQALEAQIDQSHVKEHEIMIVQAMIEEKATLAEERK